MAENSTRGDSSSLSSVRVLKAAIALAFLGLILNTLASATADPDLWGYMAFGRLFWDTGRFPYQDVFSYLPTLPAWIYHEWLTGVLLYPIFQTMGGAGVQLLKYGAGLVAITPDLCGGSKAWRSSLEFPLCALRGPTLSGSRLSSLSGPRSSLMSSLPFPFTSWNRPGFREEWRASWLLAPLPDSLVQPARRFSLRVGTPGALCRRGISGPASPPPLFADSVPGGPGHPHQPLWPQVLAIYAPGSVYGVP